MAERFSPRPVHTPVRSKLGVYSSLHCSSAAYTRTEAQIHGVVDHPAVFVGGDAPPDAVVCRLIEGGVLAHHAGQEAPGVGLIPGRHLIEHGKAVIHMAGQGKVAQDHAPLQDALAVKNRCPA